MTTQEFERKYAGPDSGLATDPRRFEVARVTAAIRNRVAEGMDVEQAKRRVMEDAPYREALAAGLVDPLSDDRNIIDDFKAIDAV